MTVLVGLIFGMIDINNASHVKRIAKELMSIAWHPTGWWDWCMSEDEQKEIFVEDFCRLTKSSIKVA